MTVFLYPSADMAEATSNVRPSRTATDASCPGLPGDEPPLSHGPWPPPWRCEESRRRHSRSVALKALGINIVSQIDSVGWGRNCRPSVPSTRAETGAAAIRCRTGACRGTRTACASTNCRLLQPPRERSAIPTATFSCCWRRNITAVLSGGHTDPFFASGVLGCAAAESGALTTADAKYGTVYHLAAPTISWRWCAARTCSSRCRIRAQRGPRAFLIPSGICRIFNDPHHQGVGYRWGMGLDRSGAAPLRISLPAAARRDEQLVRRHAESVEYLLSISEVRHQQPGDDIYASSPVSCGNGALPSPDDVSPLIGTLMRGDHFVTSGKCSFPRIR